MIRTALGKMDKKIFWRLLLTLELVFLLFLVGRGIYHSKHLFQVDYTGEQIAAMQGENLIGGSIDENTPSGLYNVTSEILLKKGTYDYTVSYEGSSDDSFFVMHNIHTNFFQAYDQVTLYLTEKNSGVSRSFPLNVDLHMTLRIMYSGSGNVKITGFSIHENNDGAKRDLCIKLALLMMLNGILLFFQKRKEGKTEDGTVLSFCVLLGITLMISYPILTKSGTMAVTDAEFHLTRIESIKDGLLQGQFPVRISPDFYDGYGYANSIMYGELFLYIPAFLRIMGFTLTEAANFFILLVNFATVFGCYYVMQKVTKVRWIAVTAAVLYGFAPYRLANVYFRYAAGEYTAMVFLPFVFYGLYRIYAMDSKTKEYRWSYLPLLVGLTGIIQSHTLTVEMIAGAILMVCVMLLPLTIKKARILMLLKTALLTFLVNLWFLVPFLDYYLTQDLSFKSGAKESMIQHTGIYLSQLFYVFPKFALYNQDGFRDEMPMRLGIAVTLGLLLGIGVLLCGRNKAKEEEEEQVRKGRYYETEIVLIITSVLLLWMASVYFPWDKIYNAGKLFATLVSSLQFLWRILGLATAVAVAAVGVGLVLLQKKMGKSLVQAICMVLMAIAIFDGSWQLQQAAEQVTFYEYRDLQSIRWGTSVAVMGGEFGLCKSNWDVITTVDRPLAYEGAQILRWNKNGTKVKMTVQGGPEGGFITLPLLNYKGYRVRSVDGLITSKNLSEGDAAVVRLNLPKDCKEVVEVYFSAPWYWRVSEGISLIVLLGIVLCKHGLCEKIKLRKQKTGEKAS